MLLLTNRQVIGAGLRYQFVDKQKFHFDMGGSLMREYEKLNEEKVTPGEQIETRYFRLGMLTSLGFNIGENVRVHNVLYYQPYLGDFRDYRLLSDLSMSVNIIKHFDLVTSLTTRFDSQPPDPLVRFDNLLTVGITMKF
jgi:putative salt-induced outer membrane protein YdiY